MNINKEIFVFRKIVLVLFCVSFISSCMLGPDYKRPNLFVPPKFKEQKGQTQIKLVHHSKNTKWKPIQPQNHCSRSKWWNIFKDPVLNDLEDQLNKDNQNVVAAYDNYLQALAIVDEARASLFPTLTGALNVFRQKTGSGTTSFISSSAGTTTAGTASTTATGISTTATTYSGLLSTSWEPDIWGAVRRTIESDTAAAQSTAALLDYTRLSAQGALAQYYFELRTLDTNQKLLDDTVKSYKKTLQLTRNQYASGVAPRANVVQAQVQLENQEALALNNGILRGQYEHAIAALMGRPPATFSLKPMPLQLKLPIIPLEIPTVWLERRPDIAEAERLVQKTSALIGVAISAYYPTITLTGSGSAAGRSLHELIHTPSLGWSIGLQAAETLFDGGLRSATVRAAKAAYLSQVATYRQTVLTAFQNVEDNLIALRLYRAQLKVQNKAAKDAQFALKLIINQYKAGTVNFLNVLTAQVAAYSAQQTANQDAGLLMSSEVGLLLALGGGWDAKSLCCVLKDAS